MKQVIVGNYKKLNIWIKSIELVTVVYDLVKKYPDNEKFGLISQSKRAVVSIPSNIAEGIGRNYKKDTIQFLHIARGSLYELDTLIEIGLICKYIKEEQKVQLSYIMEECLRLLNGLISYYESGNLK
ncbi:MAG: four helix bundle protein [Chitinophagaceae bacterium]